ncbi:MAG: hypothetical protein AAGE52_17625, partial [Myxococcota bacterium]
DRRRVATEVVRAFDDSHSELVALYATGVETYVRAHALITHRDAVGYPTFKTLEVGLTEVGWRVTHSPDWQ